VLSREKAAKEIVYLYNYIFSSRIELAVDPVEYQVTVQGFFISEAFL